VTDGVLVDDQVDSQTAPASPSKRWGAGQFVKILLALLVVAAIVWYVVVNWSDIRDTWSRLTWSALLLSTLAAMAGMAASSAAWRDSARDIGCPVTFLASLRVFVIGQLGKYVPGSVWMYVLQTELGKRAGVPRARAFLASMIAMGVGITAALVVGVAAVPSLINPPDASSGYASTIRTVLIVMIVLFPIAITCTVPRVLTALVRLALRLLRRPPIEQPLTWAGVLRVLGWSLVTWLCFGAHLWLLVGADNAPFPSGYLRCMGSFAVALTVGMFVPTPGGIGAREILLVAGLTPFLAGGSSALDAAGIALASRAVFLVAELLGAALAALTDVGMLRKRAA
jgi:uncharacterized membrane protein YbhN (UPF0104 family)